LRLREKKYLTTRAVKAGVSAELKATTLVGTVRQNEVETGRVVS
jgi:hypothetical protein